MRTLILFLLIFQLIISGCSPEGSFHASKSTEIKPTDPYITPDNTIVINPRPSKTVPKPTQHVIGSLQISKATLERKEDRSLLFKATATLKDSSYNVLWNRAIELEGFLDVDDRAKLYPVDGDKSGEKAVRARLICLDTVTCQEAVIDIFVKDTGNKTHAAQVHVFMEPEVVPIDYSQNNISTTEPSLPAPKAESGSIPAAPKKDAPVPKAVAPVTPEVPKSDKTTATPAAPKTEDTKTPTKPSTGEKPPQVVSESPKQPNAPLQEAPPKITSKPAAKPKTSATAPQLQKTEETSKPRRGFWSRLIFGEDQTEELPQVSKTVPPPPKKQEDEESGFFSGIWPFGKKDEKPVPVPAAKPEQKAETKAEEEPVANPTIPSVRPKARPDHLVTPKLEEQTEEDGLEHGEENDEEEEDEHVTDDEERESLFIGTLHDPSEDLFEQDRAGLPDNTVRPRPRPDRPNQPDPDDLEATNKGNRPRDQVIGSTACSGKSRSKSCGFLENASDLSKLESKGNFAMFNKGRKRHFGSHELVSVINYLGKYFKSNPSFGPLSVNDLSQRTGGRLANSAHKSHQNGLDADISYPFNKNGSSAFLSYVSSGSTTSSFKARETWAVFKTLWNTKYVDRIFVNPAIKRALCQEADRTGDKKSFEQLLRRIRPEGGHDKHFHLRILCSADQPRCRQMGPPPAGSGC